MKQSFVLVALSVGLMAATAGAPAGWELSKATGWALHKSSRLSFPATAAGLKRQKIGSTVDYSGTDFPLVVSLAIVPRKQGASSTFEASLKAVVADMQRGGTKSGVKLKESGAARLPIASTDGPGMTAYVEFTQQRKPGGAWILILPLEKYELRVRSEYQGSDDLPEAGRRLRQSFNQSLAVLRDLRINDGK